MGNLIPSFIAGGLLAMGAQSASAIPVDVELILATDTSGSVDDTDFALRRDGVVAAFRDPDVINAIENGPVGSIAVALWDFATTSNVAVDWAIVSDSASSNAFADAVAAAPRTPSYPIVDPVVNGRDGLSALLDAALIALNNNDFQGRSVIDINSEGAQDIDGCEWNEVVCPTLQTARDNFLAGGGDAINAIWMQDRDKFGLEPGDIINAFEYGTLNVIGGDDSFQVFAKTNADFIAAIDDKIIREITPPDPIPEPATLALIGLGVAGLGYSRRRHVKIVQKMHVS